MHISNWFHSNSAPTADKRSQSDADNCQVYDVTDDKGVGRAGVRDSLLIPNARLRESLQVITNVQQYPDFLPIYSRVDVLSENMVGPNQIVRVARYTIHLPTLIHAFIKDLSYTLKLTIDNQEQLGYATMTWEQIEGPSFVVDNIGKWVVTQRGPDVEMQLEMSLGYSFYLPKNIKNMIQNHIVRDTLNSIKERAVEVQRSAA